MEENQSFITEEELSQFGVTLNADEPEIEESEPEVEVFAPIDTKIEKVGFISQDELDNFEAESKRDAASNVTANTATAAAEERKIAADLDTSRIDVRNNLEERRKAAEMRKIEMELQEAPSLTSFLTDNPVDAPVLRDSIADLATVERELAAKKLARFGVFVDEGNELDYDHLELSSEAETGWQAARGDIVENAVIGAEGGYATTQQGLLWARLRDGYIQRDAAFDALSNEYDEKMKRSQENDSWVAAGAEFLGMMAGVMTQAPDAQTAAVVGGMAAATAASGVGAVGSAALLGAMWAAGSAKAMYNLEGGLAYKDMLEANTDKAVARDVSRAVGFTNAMIEVAGLKLLGNAFAPLVKTLTMTNAQRLSAALAQPTMKTVIVDAAKGLGLSAASEVGTEVVQELVNVAGEQVALEYGKANFNEFNSDELFDRLYDVATRTFKGVAVLGGLGLGPTIVAGANKVYRAEQVRDYYIRMAATVNASPALQESPEVLAQAIQAIDEHHSTGVFYVDADEFRQACIQQGVTIDELRQVLPEVADTLEQKAVNKEDVEIPAGEFLTKVAPTNLGAVLSQHVRKNQDDLSPADAAKVQAELRKSINAVMKQESVDEAIIDKKAASLKSEEFRKLFKTLTEQNIERIKAGNDARVKPFTDQEIREQSKLSAWMVVNLARRAKLSPERALAIAPQVVSLGVSRDKLQQKEFNNEEVPTPKSIQEVLDEETRANVASEVGGGSVAGRASQGSTDSEGGSAVDAGESEGSLEESQQLKQLIGELGAKTAELYAAEYGAAISKALDKAKEMEDTGATPRDILDKTGWQRGLDGDWRYDIPDLTFRNELLTLEHGMSYTFGQVVNAPELFAAYPWLKDRRIAAWNDATVIEYSAYDSSSGHVFLNFDEIEKEAEASNGKLHFEDLVRKALVHEVQHAIQHYEGFPVGTSVAAQRKPYIDLLSSLGLSSKDYNLSWDKDYKAFAEFLEANGFNASNPKAAKVLSDNGYASVEDLAKDNSPQLRYERVMGELESKIVERRLRLSAVARRMKLFKNEVPQDIDPSSFILATTGIDKFEDLELKQTAPVKSALLAYVGRSKARAEAVNRLLELMSTEYQRVIVEGAKGSTQRKYQKIIDKAVQDAAKKAGIDLTDMESPVVRELLTMTVANDLIFATQSNKSAIGWYDEKVRKCLAFAGSMFPELDPNNKEYNKNEAFRFLYILATTSNGLKVEKNLPLAVKIYKQYKETGTIPAIGEGKQLEPMVETLRNFDKTLESIGNIDDMRKFFMTTWTVKQLELMGFNATGELKDEETRGAAIIGPKIGNGFFANLNGMFSALTMDRWFMRTWGRWTGTLIVFDEAKFVERVDHFRAVLEDIKGNKEFCAYIKEHCNFDVKDALKNRMAASTMAKMEKSVKGGSSEFIKMVNRCATAMMPASMRKEYHKKWGGKTKPDSIGWRFYKAMKDVERAELQDRVAPGGGKQRQYVRSIFADALDIVRQEEGLGRLTMADAQAVLWYAEKKIYENTKIAGEYVEDYDQDEAPDYANVMRDVALRNGVSEETLKALSDRVDKEIENDELQRSQGSERARYDTLDTVSKRRLFSSLVFGALRRNKGLSVANGAKPGQRIPFTYRVEWAVEEAGVSEPGRGGVDVVSADDARGDRGGRGSVRVLTPVATWIPNAGVSAALKGFQEFQNRDSKTANPEFEEFAPTEEAATLFLDSLKAAKATLGYPAACVEEKSIEELTGQDEWHSKCRIFLTKDRKSGFVIKNGDDLVSVFSSKGFNSGDAIVECAIAAGARKLDCFDTILTNVYARHGFRPVARLKFNRDYAPYDWNYDFFGGKMQKTNKDGTPKVDKDGNPVYTTNFNNGEPDIIFMVYDNSFNGQLAEDYLLRIPETDGENYGEPYVYDAVKALEETNKVVQETVDEAVAEKANGKSKEEVLHQQYRTLKQVAWHGSPYRFIKFMLDKIGTGEGAQAHGWGLYFSLDRKTAEGYRARLADDGAIIKVKGYEFDENDMSDESPDVMAYHTVAWLINEAGPYNYGDFEEIRAEAINIINNAVTFGADKEDAAKAVELVEALTADDIVIDGSIGGLYKVDIPEDSVMLNEDETFKDQPEFVQKAIRELYKKLNTKRSVRETAQASVAAALVERSKIVESIQKAVADGVLEIDGNSHPEAVANSIEWALMHYLERALNRESLPLWQYRYRQRELVVAEIGLSGSAEAINNIDFDIETLMMEAEQAFGMDHEDMPGAGSRANLYINPEKTGQDIYDDLSTALGSPKEASLALNSVGIKGIRYDGRRDGPCAVVFDEDAVQILEMAQAELDEFLANVEEANANTTGTYSITNNTITLTPYANLSTFAHEMGHWYLETLFSIYGETTSASVREDVETMLKDFGLNSIEAWYKLPMKDREVLHERFAFYVEKYLAKGEAPTRQTRGFFARMGKWIRGVYSKFSGSADEQLDEHYQERFGIALPPMSDEVRRVLDRMIAAEHQIKTAEMAEGIQPLFEAKPDEMTDEQWEEYVALVSESESDSVDAYLERVARDERWYAQAQSRELKRIHNEGKKIREEVREKVAKQVADSPIAKIFDAMKESDMRLYEQDLVAEGFSEKQINILRRHGLLVKSNAENRKKYPASTIATVRAWASFAKKYSSNKAFIIDLVKISQREKLIDELTTQQCLKDHGEFFDEEQRNAYVAECLHTQARGRMLATELSFLAGDKTNSRVYREAAKRAAEQVIGKEKVGKVSVKRYLAAEARAARKAYECLKIGDRLGAAMAKRAQLVNHEAALLAIDAEKKIKRINNLKTRVFKSDSKMTKTHDTGILAIARYIMTTMGIGKVSPSLGRSGEANKYLEKLRKYDEEKYQAFSAIVDKYGYRGDVSFNDLPFDTAMGLLEDVEMLYRMARESKQLLLEGRKLDREAVVTELVETFKAGGREKFTAGKDYAISESKKAWWKFASVKAKLMRVENWCRAMDMGANGPFFRHIFAPIANAAAKFRNENTRMQKALLEIIKPMQDAWAAMRDIEAPEINYTFTTKAELIGALLHTGNESNKNKLLLGGRGEDRPWATMRELPDGTTYVDTRNWDAFIARCMRNGIITKADMDAVQAIWDLTESMKGDAQKAYESMYGNYFEEVEATPIATTFGMYRGGYVPAVTDRYLVADRRTQEELQRVTENEFMSQMPVHEPGFSKSRVPNYTKPLDLDVGVICGHIQQVLKFTYIAPVAQQVAKIINDRKFRETIDSVNSAWIADMLAPWLQRAYTQSISDGKTGVVSAAFNKMRSIAGMNIMIGHIVNALQQTTGLSVAAAKVKPKYLQRAFADGAWRAEAIEAMIEASPFMKARLNDRAMEYQSEIEKIVSKSATFAQAQGWENKAIALDAKLDPARDLLFRRGYFIQSAMQAPIDSIVWIGAYQQAVDAGMSHEDAVNEADSVVRTTQSDFSPENLAEVEVGGAFQRAFLVFYNYFGMQLNLLGEKWEGAKYTRKYGDFALDSLLIVSIPSIISAILAQMVTGFDDGDDDEWDTYDALRLLIAEPIKNVIAMVPWAGSALNTFGASWAKDDMAFAKFIWGEDPYQAKLLGSPTADMISNAGKALGQLYKLGFTDENVNARSVTRNTIDLISVTTRMPLGFLKKPAGYTAAVLAGEARPEGPIDFAKGLISGKAED